MGTAIYFVISGLSFLVAAALTFAVAGPGLQGGGWACFAAWATSFVSFAAGMILISLDRIRASLDRIASNGEALNRRYGVTPVASPQSSQVPDDDGETETWLGDRLTKNQQMALQITAWIGVAAFVVVLLLARAW